MQLNIFMRKTHKWLGLIIGIQVVFWVFGGLVMSWFPIEEVHGDHLRKETLPIALDVKALFPIGEVVNNSGLEVMEIATIAGFSGPQYRLKDLEHELHFYNAMTGKPIENIDEIQAINIAKSKYTGDSAVRSSTKMTENTTEYRRRLPVWRVEFDDDESSTLYIAVDNGQLMSVRNNVWRLFDFVWMLHIMDYEDRTDFNSWLLIISSILALVISLSGVYLIFKSFRRKDFGL